MSSPSTGPGSPFSLTLQMTPLEDTEDTEVQKGHVVGLRLHQGKQAGASEELGRGTEDPHSHPGCHLTCFSISDNSHLLAPSLCMWFKQVWALPFPKSQSCDKLLGKTETKSLRLSGPHFIHLPVGRLEGDTALLWSSRLGTNLHHLGVPVSVSRQTEERQPCAFLLFSFFCLLFLSEVLTL